MTLSERLYLPEILKGLLVTNYHFCRNLALHVAHLMGLAKNRRAATTTQYPEERKRYSDGYRGSHRLTLKPDGSVRCTSCFLCATACPAQCIYIEAGEHPDPHIEKFPLRYEIDTLRCIYCGMCVEACPCDAIRMDTYVHPRIWGFDRKDFIEPKEVLMHRSQVLEQKGRDGNMREMLDWYDEQARQVYNPLRPELKIYTERDQPEPWNKPPEARAIPAIDRHHLHNGGSLEPASNKPGK
ncbi:MAG: NuoI/complex I 23 kDa subunit family protein [Stellaceae bacterium]